MYEFDDVGTGDVLRGVRTDGGGYRGREGCRGRYIERSKSTLSAKQGAGRGKSTRLEVVSEFLVGFSYAGDDVDHV